VATIAKAAALVVKRNISVSPCSFFKIAHRDSVTPIESTIPFLSLKSLCDPSVTLDLFNASRHQAFMLIYKIFREDEWRHLQDQGETDGAPIDVADGYIHFSSAETVRETAAKHFAGEDGLVIMACETGTLGAELKWEVSRGGALFPHLYRKLTVEDIIWEDELPLIDGTHDFPEDVE